jgi:hypothetical protein
VNYTDFFIGLAAGLGIATVVALFARGRRG